MFICYWSGGGVRRTETYRIGDGVPGEDNTEMGVILEHWQVYERVFSLNLQLVLGLEPKQIVMFARVFSSCLRL